LDLPVRTPVGRTIGNPQSTIRNPQLPMCESASLIHTPDGKLAVETRFRVRYFETDAMGIVHHAAYITWFEEGRSAFTRGIGYPYSRMEAEGIALAVAEVTARYHTPARYDDEVVVRTTLDALGSRGMTFIYEVRSAGDEVLLVSGRSTHVSLGLDGRVRLLPDELRERFLAPAAS
jgi:acyl-CoA thioester hydrolase